MKKNQDRKRAEETFLAEHGRITNKELSKQFRIHPATVARWKKEDDWDAKLAAAKVLHDEPAPSEDDSYDADVRHIRLLNERIDAYLRKKELLPSEIRELAEAKFHLMNCMEIIHDQTRYPIVPDIDQGPSNLA